MAMSKKHYCAIVAARHTATRRVLADNHVTTRDAAMIDAAFNVFGEMLAETLKCDNPNFDRGRFLDAMRTESK